MFGGAAFSEFAFSEQDHVEEDSSAFKAFLSQITAQRCWLLEIEALSLATPGGVSDAFSDAAFSQAAFSSDEDVGAGGPATLYYSSHGFVSRLVERVAYLSLPGTADNYASTPDSAANSITGDIDVRVKIAPDDWTPAGERYLISKGSWTDNVSWLFGFNGVLFLYASGNGTSWTLIDSSLNSGSVVPFADGTAGWVRFTRNATTGVVKFFTSSDGISWTQLGTDKAGTAGLMFDIAAPIGINTWDQLIAAKVYRAQVFNGIDGALVVDFDAARFQAGGTQAAMDTGEIWTVNQSGTPKAEIVDAGEVAKGDPASTIFYEGRIAAGITVERRIIGRDGIGGLSRVFAEVGLVNRDGALDNLTRGYALDGRRATLLIGPPEGARSEYGVVFTGVVERMSATLARLIIQLSDGLTRLDRPVNNTTYAGTGGLEGGADLTGKPKPKCHGKVFNITPPMVDSLNLIYQVHDGAIKDVPAVRDRGIALAKVGGAPAAGQYQVDTAAGTFKLGATPAGTVTADVEGDAASAGYVDRTADIVLRLLAPVLNSSEINPSSFAMLNDNAPAPVGIWIGTEPASIAEVVDELLAAIGAFGGFSRSGVFSVGVVSAPTGAPKLSFTEQDITGLEREPLPGAVEPAVWRTLVGYQHNYTVQNDFAAAVLAAVRTFAAAVIRVVSKENAAVQSQRLLAREYGPSSGTYVNQADADTEAQRRLDLWMNPRAPFRVTTRPSAMLLDLGDVVEIQHRRLGLANGAAGRVLRHKIADTQVELGVLT